MTNERKRPKGISKRAYPRYGAAEIANSLMHMEGLSKAKADRITQLVIHQITLALLEGKIVYLPKLGSFAPVLRESRNGVHPRLLTPLQTKPSVRIRFDASIPLTRMIREQGLYDKIQQLTGTNQDYLEGGMNYETESEAEVGLP